MNTDAKVVYEFGPFRMDPDKQVLLREDQPIPITPKAFETLLALVRRSHDVVTKEELLKESVTSSPCRAAAIDLRFRSVPSPREARC